MAQFFFPMEDFREHIMTLNSEQPIWSPNNEAVRVFNELVDDESLHMDVASTLFHFLKWPDGKNDETTDANKIGNASPLSTEDIMHKLVHIQEPFSASLSLMVRHVCICVCVCVFDR